MSGFSVVTASRSEDLLDRLMANRASRRFGPFEREVVVVARANGMAAWVEGQIAARTGCAASLDLVSPRRFVDGMAQDLGLVGRGLSGQMFEAEALAWRIAEALDGGVDLGGSRYAPLRAWLDAQGEQPGGPFALASRLAALYDDYQVYRPRRLAEWAAGRHRGGFPHEAWQADLWRRLCDGAEGDDRPRDRATVLLSLLDRLRSRKRLEGVPPAVSVVGAPLFPPAYLDVLVALGAHTDVTVYAAVPGCDGDRALGDHEGHPLFRDLGAGTAEYARVLGDRRIVPVAHLRAPEPPPTALGVLQAALCCGDLAHLGAEADGSDPVALAADGSVRVIDAHSEVRELEVLRDHLLDAFEHLDDLRPDDVAVLVPDLDTYAPLVDAVFGDAGLGVEIPVHVADHPARPEARVLDAFERILALADGRATASDVLGLLDAPAVRRAADVRESELPTLHEWARQARVHWGRDADHKARFGLPADDLHTWRFALDRLLLGYAVGPTDDAVLDRLPVAETTVDEADLLGRFCEWQRALFADLDRLQGERAPAEWAAQLLLFADAVLAPRDDAEVAALVTLRQAIARLGRIAGDRPVGFADVRAHLASALAASAEEPYLTGAVTVGDPTALRGVPFRVLAVVGLGDAFPRADRRPAFDLLGWAPEAGDPDPHGTDCQAFLDAVLAARDRLVLSVVGRSQSDGTQRARSVVLDAFLDTCRRTFGADGLARIVTEHRLQPSHPDYFDAAKAAHFTYDGRRRAAADRDATGYFFDPPQPGATADPPETPVETTLGELARAWRSPCRYHCDWLGLGLRLDDAGLQDDEPVDLDALGRFQAKTAVLDGVIADRDAETLQARLRLSGQLPPGEIGEALAGEVLAAVGDLASRMRAHGDTEAAPVVVAAPSGEWRVEGALALSRTGGVLRARPAKVKGKDLLGGWIDHLALCAQDADWLGGVPRRTVVAGEDTAWAFEEVDRDEARLLVQFLVRGMLAFRQLPPPLFEKASHAYADWYRSKKKHGWLEEQCRRIVAAEGKGFRPIDPGRMMLDGSSDEPNVYALKSARKKYDGAYEDFSDVRADDAVALCYRHRRPLDDSPGAFDRWARMLWGPVFTHASEVA